MKQTNMRMLALCAALCLCVATAAPAYAESTRQTPRTSFVETLLDIPVLGICRGAQLINVFHGGSLYQDLKYYPVPTLKHWQGDTPWWQATHQVKLVKDTHLAAIFDQVPRLRVNSYHHQLIKKVGKGLKVNALAQDGVYEGIENETGTVLGVQWHPEMLRNHQAEMNRLFDYLIKCANGKGRDEHAE